MRREEYKFPINGNQLGVFPMLRTFEPLFVEHESRRINSVYFDDSSLTSFVQGEEGLTPRRKVRARWYGTDAPSRKDIRFELKFTYHNDREKRLYSFEEASDENSPYSWAREIIFGKLFPICKVSYDRDYYKSHQGIRVTIDRDITYSKSNGVWDNDYSIMRDEMSVVEIKCAEELIREDIHINVPAIRQRFSKYSRAVLLLKLSDLF